MFASSCCSYGTDSDRTGQRGHCWPDYMLACLLTGPPEQQQQQQRSSSSSSCTNRAHQFVCRAIRSYFTITKGHHATQICLRTVHIQQRCSPSVLQSNVLSARKFISPLLLGPIRESFFTPCFICNVVVQTFGCHEICPINNRLGHYRNRRQFQELIQNFRNPFSNIQKNSFWAVRHIIGIEKISTHSASAPLPPPGGISSEGKTARAAKFGERERFPVNYRYGKSSPHRCGAVQTWSSTGRTRGRERSVPPPPRGDRERRPSARRAPRQVENIDFSCGRREASERSGGGVTIGGLRPTWPSGAFSARTAADSRVCHVTCLHSRI
ncbi:unnamed protein product [Nesidiocoris tenuis]|uniref:Uncharacterized protein n=1 Tax=Nesidiocoris tenuis TaxID=355587 RepID=A0A6H5H3A3_9HEMI|nr:unnamed protein product [Nesidiocoris tenuis]